MWQRVELFLIIFKITVVMHAHQKKAKSARNINMYIVCERIKSKAFLLCFVAI